MNLVVGSTGELGSMIAHRLLEKGEAVRAFVRENANTQALEHAGAELAFGDLRDPPSLQQACRDVQRVIVTATAPLPERHHRKAVDSIDWKGVQSLIDAASNANVEQFIYTSFLGASAESPSALGHAKGANEMHLKQSGMNYTILQPVMFMEFWIGLVIGSQLAKGPSVTLVGDGVNRLGFVSTQNVCDLAIATLGRQDAYGASIAFSGPGSYTYREIIRLIEEATQQQIEVKTIAPGETVPGMPEFVNQLWAGIATGGDFEVDSQEAAKTYGIRLISVEEYIRETLSREIPSHGQRVSAS